MFAVKTPYGPISAGMTCAGTAFTPPGANKEAAVFTRIWDRVYMFPEFDMANEPVALTQSLNQCNGVAVVDWNRDGNEDFIISDNQGFLWLYEQTMNDGKVFFENRGIIRDHDIYGSPD